MKHRLTFILIALTLLLLVMPPGQASAQEDKLEIVVTAYPRLVFYGDRAPVTVSISNIGENQIRKVILHSSTNEETEVGNIAAGVTVTSTLYLENYEMGKNEVEIYAKWESGESARWAIQFEVRPPEESITLRLIDAPASIYEGMVFTAQLEVQNLWQQAVSGTRIKSGQDVLYYVGALNPNESLQIELRIENYEIGINRLQLVADHERGSSSPIPLEFEVIPAEYAVKAYLTKSSSPTYLTEPLEFYIVVAANEDADVTDLELKALTEGIEPNGYYIGTPVSPVQQVSTSDIQSLLFPTQPQPQEAPQTVATGEELFFEVSDIGVGNQPLRFQISFRLGKAIVQEEFSVDVKVLENPSMQLILAAPIEGVVGNDLMVTLHVANSLPIQVDAVSVVPLGDIDVAPAEFFIGGMAPDNFLPAYFKVSSDGLKDGDELYFKLVYRVGQNTYETSPLHAVISLEKEQNRNPAIIIVPIVVVALLVVLVWLLRRKRWTR